MADILSEDKRILVMAGGTGGHVFPALAVAKHLAKRGWKVRWLGTADRMEARLVPQHGFDIDFIDIKGVRGNGLVRKLAAPFKVLRSIAQARKVIKEFNPDVVLGMGGFASGPGGVAARLCGIPLVLHEQNAIPGMTNKLLSRIATRVLCAFENTFAALNVKAEVVGNPIRRELINLGNQPRVSGDDALRVLVVGGSLGAKVFNDLMPAVVAAMSQQHSITVWHQVGRDNLQRVKAEYQQLGQDGGVNVAEFIDDMEAAYRWADVVLCRAGALTVSELAAVGLPGVLVPYPHAVDDHQTRNAKVLVDAGAAFLLPQAILDVEQLVGKLHLLASDRNELARMGQRARDVAVLDATERVAAVCRDLAGKKHQ
ncbi:MULTISPECIES: undecaprenyldiphospho-muramoylpentapeptide beta-N-acetylglucosaminyltransferase [Shewanella]|uniref:UDP-N-acetylglucosamine--N-acetylmuramyl-(pentapeptide) pyrophosphoryl-undecaprenol N-acetylglucosamine transferase n=1 Tax=Shewanella salipaludis TaxID=2723052 RepID=A0A972G8E0_9GAMM|nr:MULTISPECIES: undecaprenyldiphospho-muramoylpentapeptide beta-N-acetylglucosaminyltransferase [Shewanella]MCE9688038.1 undecaprenyldiphospho-muramoylpentapeptide beta-N-acetylglucosaminyltransferase [Shewanella sp. AS16]NMH66390.1 undecaprenyldiphospho-muramoylpentapeptide beta-N-acetylglucosaminyltransferase [Shewanella salipaludis]